MRALRCEKTGSCAGKNGWYGTGDRTIRIGHLPWKKSLEIMLLLRRDLTIAPPKSEILNTQMHELENNDRYQDAKHPGTRTLETR
jgi:hypothetical protein